MSVLNPQEKEVQLVKETILGVGHQVLEVNEGKCTTTRTDIIDTSIPKHLTMIVDE